MPSFVCDTCQETLKKAKLDNHAAMCRGASFSCIDCYRSFRGTDYRAHTSCITEVQKYVKPTLQAKPVVQSKPALQDTPAASQKSFSDEMSSWIVAVLAEKGAVSLRELKRELRARHSLTKRDVRERLEKAVSLRCVGAGVFEMRF